MPSFAARIAITVAQHEAIEALKYQPGLGPDASPPMARGISVSMRSPCGPVATHLKPSARVAVAGECLAFAFSGCATSFSPKLSRAARIWGPVTLHVSDCQMS